MDDLYSLWLVPEGSVETELAAVVEALSRELGGPAFPPHLTLLDEVKMPLAELGERVAAITAGTAVFEAAVAGVETGESYYRSLYLRFANAGPLRVLRPAVAELAPGTDVDGFMPHISIFYGESGGKANACARLQAAWSGRPIRFERIVVIPSGRYVPIAEWKELASHRLA